jgi:hypothetical protein
VSVDNGGVLLSDKPINCTVLLCFILFCFRMQSVDYAEFVGRGDFLTCFLCNLLVLSVVNSRMMQFSSLNTGIPGEDDCRTKLSICLKIQICAVKRRK